MYSMYLVQEKENRRSHCASDYCRLFSFTGFIDPRDSLALTPVVTCDVTHKFLMFLPASNGTKWWHRSHYPSCICSRHGSKKAFWLHRRLGCWEKSVEHAQGFDRTHIFIIITVLIILIFLSGDHYFCSLLQALQLLIAHKAYRRSSFRLNSC